MLHSFSDCCITVIHCLCAHHLFVFIILCMSVHMTLPSAYMYEAHEPAQVSQVFSRERLFVTELSPHIEVVIYLIPQSHLLWICFVNHKILAILGDKNIYAAIICFVWVFSVLRSCRTSCKISNNILISKVLVSITVKHFQPTLRPPRT